MLHRHQFRTYAEHCLRLAEFSDSSEQQSALNATANAWHQLAQALELQDELSLIRSGASRINGRAI